MCTRIFLCLTNAESDLCCLKVLSGSAKRYLLGLSSVPCPLRYKFDPRQMFSSHSWRLSRLRQTMKWEATKNEGQYRVLCSAVPAAVALLSVVDGKRRDQMEACCGNRGVVKETWPSVDYYWWSHFLNIPSASASKIICVLVETFYVLMSWFHTLVLIREVVDFLEN